MKHAKLILSAAMMSLFCQNAAFACTQAGDVLVRLRGIGVLPETSSKIKEATVGGKVHVIEDYVPELDLTYFFSENLAAEMILGTSKHLLRAKNTVLPAKDYDIGSVWILPPAITAQYHFSGMDCFKPYLGAGVNYTFFYNKKAKGIVTNIKLNDHFGWVLQAGVDYAISESFYVNMDVKKIFLKTKAKLNDNTLHADVKINPLIVGLGFGYKF